VSHFDGIAELFRELHPRYGSFAVPGNHEYYVGIAQANAFTERAGFTLLPGRTREIAAMITIAGVDDPAAARFGPVKQEKEAALLAPLSHQRFILFLKHRPVVDPTSVGLYDLQLSGHVHKGQIFPFNLLTYLNFPVRAGLTRLAADSSLYVSRGTGTWGPPIRFLAPPEVTVIDLVPAGRR
jgi:predicted MPP superfamily phosphohydrolase